MLYSLSGRIPGELLFLEAFGSAALLTRKEPTGVLYGEYPWLPAEEAAGFDLLTFPTNPEGLARIK